MLYWIAGRILLRTPRESLEEKILSAKEYIFEKRLSFFQGFNDIEFSDFFL